MASPTVSARAEGNEAAGSVASATVSFTQTTGDLVVFFIATAAAKDVSVTDSFTRLTPTGSVSSHIYYKILDGSEGGDCVVSWTTNTRVVWLSWNISGHSTSVNPETPSSSSGASTTPDPPTVTPTGGAKDYLWLAMFRQSGEELDDDTWCNSAPSSFGNLVQIATGTGGTAASNCQAAGADFASNAASMDPGTFSVDQSLAWTAYTVAVHPAAAGVTVTPGTASLTTTRFTPTVLTPRLVTPGLATLTTTRFTPAVSVGIRLIPGVGTLTLTPFAPTVTASQHQLVTPGTASLTLSAFAPTVATPVVVIPGLATLTTSRFAPTVTVGAGVVLTPGTATLTIAPFAPTVLTPRTVTPGTASLSATTFAPAVLTPRLVTPQTASLTLTAFAPTVTGVSVRPPGMILSLPGTEGW